MITSHVIKNILIQSIEDRCPQIAASLAYATLLAIVPLAVLIYNIYSTALISPDLQLKTQIFILENFSPSVAKDVQQFLLGGITQAKGINFIGLCMLIASVLITMHTIDSAMNSIWKITKPRYLVRRIFVYLAVLIFGPIAISLSLVVSTYIASIPIISFLVGQSIYGGFLNWVPFLVLLAAFTMLYKFVPDCKVKWKHSISGAIIAVCLFEIAKVCFTLYLSYFPGYEILYGALAAIPLLLIWIYLTWLIVLIGAEITHYMEE